jgi:hypothetical protein
MALRAVRRRDTSIASFEAPLFGILGSKTYATRVLQLLGSMSTAELIEISELVSARRLKECNRKCREFGYRWKVN